MEKRAKTGLASRIKDYFIAPEKSITPEFIFEQVVEALYRMSSEKETRLRDMWRKHLNEWADAVDVSGAIEALQQSIEDAERVFAIAPKGVSVQTASRFVHSNLIIDVQLGNEAPVSYTFTDPWRQNENRFDQLLPADDFRCSFIELSYSGIKHPVTILGARFDTLSLPGVAFKDPVDIHIVPDSSYGDML